MKQWSYTCSFTKFSWLLGLFLTLFDNSSSWVFFISTSFALRWANLSSSLQQLRSQEDLLKACKSCKFCHLNTVTILNIRYRINAHRFCCRSLVICRWLFRFIKFCSCSAMTCFLILTINKTAKIIIHAQIYLSKASRMLKSTIKA